MQLCDLYESDCIFDKFDCAMSGDGRCFATGTYSNFFRSGRQGGGGTGLLPSLTPAGFAKLWCSLLSMIAPRDCQPCNVVCLSPCSYAMPSLLPPFHELLAASLQGGGR